MRDVVERARQGDREAFGLLVARTSDRMYALATHILRDADLGEDAVQSALITAWRELPNLRDVDKFEAWLRRLVVHACYAEANRRRRWAANVRIIAYEEQAADDILSVSERDALDQAFRRLTVEQRAVFVLHHLQGVSLVEIAESLGIPAGTARSRLYYATRALRAALGDESSDGSSGKEWIA